MPAVPVAALFRIALATILIALLAGLLALRSCGTARKAATEARLAAGQRGAAIESGHDAVQTLGNAQAAERSIHETVKEGRDAINQAPGGDSNDAADRAACRLRSYRHSGKCIALLGPVAE
ncbi:MAG: hypothetical protein P0Y59_15500 [Candidatus Sphingomonas phytovorans]|nr:hypothetical protein [Sphingomonas sp.]WEJ98348.1 MAG: hypothetical protein P0Y59_15500 [Sphingomonas sp.]